MGDMLLSCKTTLLLGLIQPKSRLDYLPPRASLITSTAAHPNKTKAILHIQKKEMPNHRNDQEQATQKTAVKEKSPKLITSKEMIL